MKERTKRQRAQEKVLKQDRAGRLQEGQGGHALKKTAQGKIRGGAREVTRPNHMGPCKILCACDLI